MKTSFIPKIIILLFSLFFSASILAIAEIPSVVTNTNQINTGRDNFNKGRYEEALAAWNRALEGYRLSGDKNGQAQALHYKAEAYLALGQNYKAVTSLKQALELAETSNNKQLANRIASSLGTAFMLSSRSSEARELLEKTINEEREAGNLSSAATAGNNLGYLLALQGNYKAAIAAYQQAITDARTAGDNNQIAKGSVNIARAMIDGNDTENAIQQLKIAGEQAEALTASHEKAYILISIGRLYDQLNRTNKTSTNKLEKLASGTLKSAANIAVTTGDQRAMSFAYGYLGELNEQTGNINDAINYTRKASDYLRGTQAPEISYRWKWQEGRLLKAQGHIDQAINAYQRAVDDLQQIRHVIAASQLKSKGDFRSDAGRLYMDLADLILKSIESSKDKNKIEQGLRQVRATVEMLKSAELEDYFRDDCVVALQKKTKGIDDIGERTAAIYPVIFPDRLEIILSLPDGMKRYTIAVTEKELNSEINNFRARLEKRTTHQYKRHALKIYSWLIQPLEKDLESQNIDTLVFIPDGGLRTIPITSLYDGNDFIIARYAIATTPGLTLTDPQPLPRDNLKLLVAGLTDGVQGFPPLPDVAAEVSRLDELFDASILKNTAFTQANIEQQLGTQPYSIVHVASHGKFQKDVRDTFLLTYDGKINMDSLENYMASTTYLKNPVELLTLSACQTAVGDDKAALGLGGIAVKAGARSALATLWYINDQASSLLIRDFYNNLKDSGISKAKALQMAQLAMIKDPRFKHPSYWAPFILIGNWL
ncbi:MAG: CHAT domain-containing protein [Gammaproteobacteria bacterium]|nr:CHAT domain-containing protein [Gammaproteobacteria bacterium]